MNDDINKMRLVNSIRNEIALNLEDITQLDRATIQERINSCLQNFLDRKVIHEAEKFQMCDVKTLWDSWDDAKKVMWGICNETHPEIADKIRRYVDSLNAQLIEDSGWTDGDDETDLPTLHKYPDFVEPNPKAVIVADVKIKLNQPIEMITMNFEVNPKEDHWEGVRPKEDYTCHGCASVKECEFAWDDYNTNGDCLAEK